MQITIMAFSQLLLASCLVVVAASAVVFHRPSEEATFRKTASWTAHDTGTSGRDDGESLADRFIHHGRDAAEETGSNGEDLLHRQESHHRQSNKAHGPVKSVNKAKQEQVQATRESVPSQQLPAKDRLQFSWDTVPLYQQLCNPNATLSSSFPAQRLKFLASHYSLITLEHCQGYYSLTGEQAMEDYFKSAAMELKSLNPNITVLVYINSVAGLSYYRWCAEAFHDHPDWRLTNEDGTLCPSGGGHMLPEYHGYDWDQRNPAVQNGWASFCPGITNGSQVDGCSIDVAGTCLNTKPNEQKMSAGRVAAISRTQKLTGPRVIVGAVDATPEYNIQLSQIYTFAPDLKSLSWLNRTKQAGMIAEAHAQTNFGEKNDHVNASLATFLIGAYEKSYFAFSTNPGSGYHPFCDGTAPSWCYGMGWSDDFAKPLGKPLGEASVTDSGMHYERQFASGTNVTLDLRAGSCSIHWADGSTTLCTKKFNSSLDDL